MKNVIQVTTTVKLSLKTLFTHFDSIFLTIFEEEYNFGLAKHESSYCKVFIAIFYDVFFAIYRLFAQMEAKLRSIC